MTSRPPLIRRAHPADLAAIEAIVETAYSPYIPRMGQKPGPMLDDYAALIAAGHVHVADLDGQVAALLVLLDQADALLLDNIAVSPAAQGRGVGRALMAFAEAEARARGHNVIRLYTHVLMRENLVLYPRLGYHETARITEKGFDRVYFEKPV
ncbi:GNAT family acetyltransferase [Salipiger sp. CCB-MM3]|uniref:GNAT family N-acetyltransferase n=1 Tax=Salipiger sp. CCB-MM3 TaxID=1792508 RepID=UPI00080A9B77|nr:GNAT family N-acetyltransferase [Salipiger sp. CCB-MM3]ANT60497.1 GNAT family acetyltransferase [Salipiger sp. CCB-MM3]